MDGSSSNRHDNGEKQSIRSILEAIASEDGPTILVVLLPGGTSAAYVTDTNDPEINQTTLNYVEHYVPNHSGSNYIAHLTLGFATLDDLKTIETEPFNEFDIDPVDIAVFHLGNNGTARKELKSFTF